MKYKLNNLIFNFDGFAMTMIALVLFIGVCVCSFAYRYMKGDTQYHAFFRRLSLLILAISVMVGVDNLIIFFMAWCLSNLLLVRLMIHKSNWKAAKASGILAAKTHLIGACCIAAGFMLLSWVTGETSIKAIIQQHMTAAPISIGLALLLLLIGAMTQSAIWPFHRWLLSSLNSPTPVSAMMHAGLINGGGFLLTRFAPLYLQHPVLLNAIFVIGITTALLGTGWKLMQNDVKRMLACSTMGQMGFMLAQCGLGLFPAAVAHLVWHGMFKAYLFLSSGSIVQEKRFDQGYPPKTLTFACALLCGVVGSLGFAYASGKSWLSGDTTLVLMVVAFISTVQFALSILRFKTLKSLPLALIATGIVGLAYGGSVHLIAWMMGPMGLMQAQPLNGFHLLGIIALTLAWLSILFGRKHEIKTDPVPSWVLKGYVAGLNASQPHATTITAHRNQYQYQ